MQHKLPYRNMNAVFLLFVGLLVIFEEILSDNAIKIAQVAAFVSTGYLDIKVME